MRHFSPADLLFGFLFLPITLLFKLLSPRKFTHSPIPDDWPPDNSLMLLSTVPPAHQKLPPDFLYYDFGPAAFGPAEAGCLFDEGDPRLIALAKEVIAHLCQSRQVLTVIHERGSHDRKGRPLPPPFITHYVDVLPHKQPEMSVYRESENILSFLTTGYEEEHCAACDAFPASDTCTFSFYLFPQDQMLQDAEHAYARAAAFEYSLRLDLWDGYPDSLTICANPKAGEVEAIPCAAEQVCTKNGFAFTTYRIEP